MELMVAEPGGAHNASTSDEQPESGGVAVRSFSPAAATEMTGVGNCRFCGTRLRHTFCDLGMSPLSNAFLPAEALHDCESFYPLRVFTCERCLLVQLPAAVSPDELFSEYAYFSSFSESWVAHAQSYAVKVINRFGLGPDSFVVELASNDGYLLRNFVEMDIPALGVEPAVNVAEAAVARGVPTVVRFFGTTFARELVADGKRADLIVANNVLAHVPDLNDFVAGIALLLKPDGVATLEFPHLLRLMQGNQFDTIYHEHFSYFSLLTAKAVFEAAGLAVFDVEELDSHGGSLRVYLRHDESDAHPGHPSVDAVLEEERQFGLMDIAGYNTFAEGVMETKRVLLAFLIGVKREGKSVAAYGAAAKGNTLLNFCGLREDFIDYVVDRNPYKIGRYLPGTHIPVHDPTKLLETHPDYILILPWNLTNEITEQLAAVRQWGGRFIVPIPSVSVLE